MRARILDAVARLVGELAEVHLPGVARGAEHVDVGARAEHAALAAGEQHALHLGMLEADAVQRVMQLDVHAQVVAVELELVAGHQALVLRYVEHQRGDRPVEGKLPVVVAVRLGFERDHVSALRISCRVCLTVLSDVSTVSAARAYMRSRSARSLRISSSAAARPLNGRMSPCAITRDMCSSGEALSHTQ